MDANTYSKCITEHGNPEGPGLEWDSGDTEMHLLVLILVILAIVAVLGIIFGKIRL